LDVTLQKRFNKLKCLVKINQDYSMAGKVTIRRIADICSVSPTTVSLVLNKKAGVSDETRERVLNTAKELGYKLPILTASTKHRRLSTVGIVLKTEPDLLPPSNPFYSQVLAGVDDVCSDIGVNLLFSMLPVDENNHPLKSTLIVNETMVDGLLIVGTFIDETIVSLFRQNFLPVVLVDGYSDTESFDVVISDNFGAAYQAVEYLIKLGHRHIGLIGSEEGCYPSLYERRNGYRRALKDHHITDSYFANFNVNISQGEEETVQLLTENPQITALFGVNDNVALGAMRAAGRLDRQVPDDLSVIGYDDTYLATSVSPALTTMHVDKLAMGRAAVHLLVLRLEQPDAARSTHIIHPKLIERDSTAPLR
jgi:LacI family transcriptional regulator